MARLQRVEDISPRGRSEKRARIVDAAIRVFARTGYHGARISDIAKEAGIAYGLVYHYFKNKDEILGTIFQERWSAFLQALESIAAGPGTTRAKLEQVAGLILGTYRVRPDWVQVLVFEIQRSRRFAEPGQVRAVGRLLQIVARILRAGQESGELRPDFDPDLASTVFIGGLESLITALVLGVNRIDEADGEDVYYPRAASTVVDVFFRGVSQP